MSRSEEDLPKEYNHTTKREAIPERQLDSFQFYIKGKNQKINFISLEAISNTEATVYGKGQVLPWEGKDQSSTSTGKFKKQLKKNINHN